MSVQFELFGVPRLRAGRSVFEVEAQTVGEALAGLARACPSLDGTVILGQSVHAAYKLNLNGEQFVTDAATPLSAGDCLLLMAADVGG
jgi:molybdopterin converting factor small subunit